jgi:hypothetical protein
VFVKFGIGRGSKRKIPVHQLVLGAFVGQRPSLDHVGRHLDGDRLRNVPANLAWGTPAENIADSIRHGTHVAPRRGKPGVAPHP